MGSFFTNIQVHVRTGPIEKPEQQVIQLLRTRMNNDSFVEAGPGEDVDREIAVAFSPGSTWVTVYDELTEDQDPGKLESLASFLSGKISEPVVSVLVHDSSVLQLELFLRGSRLDQFSNPPDYFEKVSPEVRQELSGQTTYWKPVLAPGKNETDLRQAFDDESLFAEDTLTKIASVLGWDPLACTLGFNYLEEAELPGLIRLQFRSLHPPLPQTKKQGKPHLHQSASYKQQLYFVGEVIRVNPGFFNSGRPFQGLHVTVKGLEPEQDFITLESAVVAMGDEKNMQRITCQFRQDKSTPGILQAEFPEITIPSISKKPPINRKDHKKWLAKTFIVGLSGKANRPGQGKVKVTLWPSGSRAGGLTFKQGFRVELAARRPLRAANGDHIPRILHMMADPVNLFGMVILDAPRQHGAEIASKAFKKWTTAWKFNQKTSYEAFLRQKPNQRSKIMDLKGDALTSAWKWDLAKYVSFHLNKKISIWAMFRRIFISDHGFALDTPSYPVADPLVHLGFWMRVSSVSAQKIIKAEMLLEEIIDDIMKTGKGVQGIMGRWRWTPDSMGSTPFERACNISGKCTMGRAWCTRFLRGVTRHLWLGPQLADRLGITTIPDSLADTESFGDALKIVLPGDQSLDHLEKALAVLLPGETDWHKACAT